MAQHFSQSKAYRNISELDIGSLTEQQAWKMFGEGRWGSIETMPCAWCDEIDKHYRIASRRQWRCRHCDRVFSVTSGTALHGRRLSFRKLLAIMFTFISRPKGVAANQLCSQVGVTYRTAFQNLGKLREALHETQDRTLLEGVVHIDGGHFCGKPRRPRRRAKMTTEIANNKLRNRKAAIVPNVSRSLMEPWNRKKLENRRIVIVMRQLYDKGAGVGAQRTITAVVKSETAAHVIPVIAKYVAAGARIETDDGNAYASLNAWFDHHRVRHSVEYSTDDGVNNNQAESFIGRLRRAEYGVHHGMRRQYLAFYAADAAWREDERGSPLKKKLVDLLSRVCRSGLSRAYRGYAQGRHLLVEYLG